jgi:hypothetical protein
MLWRNCSACSGVMVCWWEELTEGGGGQKGSTYDVGCPAGVVPVLDALEENLGTIVGVLPGEFTSFGIGKSLAEMVSAREASGIERKTYLEPAINAKVNLSVDETAIFFDKFKCMAGIAVF